MLHRARSLARMRGMLPPLLLPLVLIALPAARAQEELEAAAPSRPYAVLKTQNLVLMGSVFGVLLLALVLMAICVYKPIRRR